MPELPQIIVTYSGSVNVVKKIEYGNVGFCVTDKEGNIIVPFGRYGWIDAFDQGYARVADQYMNIEIDLKTGLERSSQFGIISENGEEVLPVRFDSIWNFKNKGWTCTRVEKSGHILYFDFLTKTLQNYRPTRHLFNSRPFSSAGESMFSGTYAHDEMGFSDEIINEAFEGDPDMCWNVD